MKKTNLIKYFFTVAAIIFLNIPSKVYSENVDKLYEKSWIEELRRQFPDCPNPNLYPASAEYYLRMRLYFKQLKGT